MKRCFPFFFLLWLMPFAQGQEPAQTLVPQQVLPVGEAFQVQYISNSKAQMIQAPDFGKDFRLVSGPRLYQGVGSTNHIRTLVQNFSFTLVPLRKGRLIVKGATFLFDNKKIKCPDAVVIVAAQKPPELAAQQGLEQEVFIEAVTNRRQCYVGEPVMATFTLFARLSSAAEIIKNPGFYGFSVVDMPEPSESAQSITSRAGNFYNTHILRKVQLYPAQSGKLVIDEMSVNNSIEMMDPLTGNTVATEKVIASRPLIIDVKPLPQPAKDYNGAVGDFSIQAYLMTAEVEQGKTGKLVVTLSGKGNFLQIDAPQVLWPRGIEVFNGPVTEELNTANIPVSGHRRYEYNFTADSTGRYVIPAVQFSFFQPQRKQYKTVSADTLYCNVIPAGNTTADVAGKKIPSGTWYLLPLGIMVALLAGFFLVRSRKKGVRLKPVSAPTLSNAQKVKNVAHGNYLQLQQALQDFLKQRYSVVHPSGSSLPKLLKGYMTSQQLQEFGSIWDECERVQYYNAAPETPFSTLQQRAVALIAELEQGF